MENQQIKTLQKRKIVLAVLSITLFALIPSVYAQGMVGQNNDTISVSSTDLIVTTYYGTGCGRAVLVDLRMTYGELRDLMSFSGQNNSGVGEWIACHPYGDGLYWNVLDNKRLWVAQSNQWNEIKTYPDAKLEVVSEEILEQPALSTPATWFFMTVVVIAGIGGFAIGFVVKSGNEEVSTLRFGDCEKIEINMKTGKVVATNVKEAV